MISLVDLRDFCSDLGGGGRGGEALVIFRAFF